MSVSNGTGAWSVMRAMGAAGLAALALAAPAHAAPKPQPKLVVAIAVDQFSANLFGEWRTRFDRGMGRLANGVAYPAGYQSHAATETCPGHSTLMTGKHPAKTGIVGNNYRDPETGKQIYCLYDTTTTLAHGGLDPSVGPQKLLATTLGDWLKAASPQSRVVAVSSKDRAAINMAGHAGDGVFWMQPGFGFTTYLKPGEDAATKLAPVKALNTRIARTWTVKPTWTYTHKECRGKEATWTFGAEAWRSQLPPVGWGASGDPKAIQADVMASPIADDLTLTGAEALIDYYKLGRGPAVDFLAVSFSATDFIGHRFGTDGPEMCEQMHRLDASVGALLAKLDSLKVPYLVVLSADHGGSDFALRLNAKGYSEAKAVDAKGALERANKQVMDEYGLAKPPLSGSIEEVYVTAPAGVDAARLTRAAARAVAAQPEVQAAFTMAELLAVKVPAGKPADELTVRERFAESTYPGRSPDVSAALKPLTVGRAPQPGNYLSGHGSVWNYDRRVPILFWWPGAPKEERPFPIETVDIAPTLAAILGLTPPADIDGRCLSLGEGGCP